MTEEDQQFVRSCIEAGIMAGSVLELGGGYGGDTCAGLIRQSGLDYRSTDMFDTGDGRVDFIANFETGEGIDEIRRAGAFQSVLVLNVLEHTFEPIAVLDNAFRLVEPGGYVITATPCLWPIHCFPIDCARILPDWYRTYASRRDVRLLDEHFAYLGHGRVSTYRSEGGDHFPPHPGLRGLGRTNSRLVHRLFNTAGRGVEHPTHLTIGAVFAKPG